MKKRKNFRFLCCVTLVFALLIQPVIFQEVSAQVSDNGYNVLKLYKDNSLVGEYETLTQTLEAITDENGNYNIMFNAVQTNYNLEGEVYFPKAASITLTGVKFENGYGTTILLLNDSFYMQSDLVLNNIKLHFGNDEKNRVFSLGSHTLTAKGWGSYLMWTTGYNKELDMIGGEGSCVTVEDCNFYMPDCDIENIILEYNGSVQFNAENIKVKNIYTVQSLGMNCITFNSTIYEYCRGMIDNIFVHDYLTITMPCVGEVTIGNINTQASYYGSMLYIQYKSPRYSIYEYPHCTISGSCDMRVSCQFSKYMLSDESYQALRNDISCLSAPNTSINNVSASECKDASFGVNDSQNLLQDSDGNYWMESIEIPDKEILCYDLDNESRDEQGIYYTLDEEEKTAAVGKDDDTTNNAGWKGPNKGILTIPDKVKKDGVTYMVTRIGSNAFSYPQYNIGVLNISDNVTSFGDEAFYMASFDEIEIGANVSSIGNKALGITGLNRIYVNPANTSFVGYHNIIFDASMETLIRYAANYNNSRNYQSYIIPDTVKTIADCAFYGNCISQIVADSVTKVGEKAFYNSKIESFSSENVINIEDEAFYDCDLLKEIFLGEKLQTIGERAFYSCDKLEILYLSDSVEIIKKEAFAYCSELKYLFGASHANYMDVTMSECKNLVLFEISDAEEIIPTKLFYNCSMLRKLYLPDSYIDCEIGAFDGNAGGQVAIYALPAQKNLVDNCSMKFVDRTEHTHNFITETLQTPAKSMKGIDVTYCVECHYVENVNILPDTGTLETLMPNVPKRISKPSVFPSVSPSIVPLGTPSKNPEPAVSAMVEESVSPSLTPTPVISSTPDISNSPSNVNLPLTPTPLQSGSPIKTPDVTDSDNNKQITLPKAKIISLKLNTDNKPVLCWKKKTSVTGYMIYRSQKKSKGYRLIWTAKGSNTKYIDKKALSGKKYYYKIRTYRKNGRQIYYGKYSAAMGIKLYDLKTPQIRAKKGVTASGIYYIQIGLKIYSGNNIALYFKQGKTYSRIKLKSSSIKRYHGEFKLRCNRRHKIYYLRAKTFIKKKGKSYYSPYSNVVRVSV